MTTREHSLLIAAGALLLGLAACTTSPEAEPPRPEPTAAATRQTAEQTPDECDLLSAADVREFAGANAEIADRAAEPRHGGGWMYHCTYLTRTNGTYTARLRVSVLENTISPYLKEPDLKQVTGLQGEARASDTMAVLQWGETSAQIDLETESSRPSAAEQALRRVAARLETVEAFPAVDLSGVCAHLDVRAVERAVGSELPGRRSAIAASGEVSCVFGGTEARFVVRSTTNPKDVSDSRGDAHDIRVPGIPVKATGYAEGVSFVLGNRLFAIEARRAEGVLVEKTELPKMVVETFAACGDDLARCRPR
ncbi:hypothetical protein [Flindersiella endophytica]